MYYCRSVSLSPLSFTSILASLYSITLDAIFRSHLYLSVLPALQGPLTGERRLVDSLNPLLLSHDRMLHHTSIPLFQNRYLSMYQTEVQSALLLSIEGEMKKSNLNYY